jgi:hypothetical protein
MPPLLTISVHVRVCFDLFLAFDVRLSRSAIRVPGCAAGRATDSKKCPGAQG